jgi:uncharacterized protein (TIGR00661 family)
MFTVQGEGRGHMTQAISMKQMLERHGHEIVAVLAGGNPEKPLPAFFEEQFKVQRITSPTFAQKENRGISLRRSIIATAPQVPEIRKSLHTIRDTIEGARPDIIINFLEPLLGVYNLLHRHDTPVLVAGHQFMLKHPQFLKVKEFKMQQLSMHQYVRLCGARSSYLALSFYSAPTARLGKLTVAPPLLREQVFKLKAMEGDYLLVYLVFHGFARDIIQWNKENPKIPIHCFYDKPDAPTEERVTETLTFHRLHGEKFLQMMAGCRAVVCTAGFESVCEAAYLGKPLMMVPVENHFEQYLNSLDAEHAGIGIRDSKFNLTRIVDQRPSPALAKFKEWVDQAEPIIFDAIERCAARAVTLKIESAERRRAESKHRCRADYRGRSSRN